MRATRGFCALVFGAALAACGGGGDGGSGPPPVDNTLASVAVSAARSSILVGQTTTVTATGRNAAGGTLAGVTFTYTSAAPAVATVNASSGLVTAVSVGSTTITASGTLGGVTRAGDVRIDVVVPGPAASVAIGDNVFTPRDVTITRQGTVTFTKSTSTEHNVTFDAVAGAPQGIGNHSSGSNARTFNAVGTFPYNCTLHGGMTGSVTVVS